MTSTDPRTSTARRRDIGDAIDTWSALLLIASPFLLAIFCA